MCRVDQANERLDSAVEVAVHHVGAADEDVPIAAVREREDTRVLEVAPENRSNADVLAHAFDARHEAADATHPDVDGNTGVAGAVEGVDDRLIDHRVDLDADSGWLAGESVRGLCRDV